MHGKTTLLFSSLSRVLFIVFRYCHRTNGLRPFREIPGPTSLPGLGTIWRYFPFFGQYSFDHLHQTGHKKYQQYGPIVREEIVPNVNLLLLFKPEDIEHMYRVEGKYPSRRSHTALEFYRRRKKSVYSTGGLLPTNGEEWYKLRTALQKPISSPVKVRMYIPEVDQTARKCVNRICGLARQNRLPRDFLGELSLVFLELTGIVALDTHLGALEDNLEPDSRPLRLIKAASDTNKQILRLDNGLQLWRWFETPNYKKLKKAQEYFESVAFEYVDKKEKELRNDIDSSSENGKEKTLLEAYLTNRNLNKKDIITMVADMLLAGIDTSAYTMGFVLYHLSKNPEKQELLYQEIKELLGDSNPITADFLNKCSYLKAVVKESLRLNPISIGVGRILPEDTEFSGYEAPKGTVIVTQNQVACRLPEYFRNPNAFIPERWIKGHQLAENPHPFLVLPFGHGPRACIARRFAEQNLYILTARVIQKFRLEWKGEDLDCVSQLINRPHRNLSFAILPRE